MLFEEIMAGNFPNLKKEIRLLGGIEYVNIN